MTERTVILGVALLIVAMSLVGMAGAHQTHYRRRKLQILAARVDALERIVAGDHDF